MKFVILPSELFTLIALGVIYSLDLKTILVKTHSTPSLG